MSERPVPADVLALADAEAAALIAAGAEAVILTGSYVRGEPLPHADIDLVAVGDGPHYALRQRGSRLVAVAWRTVAQVESAYATPPEFATVVPGWRQAVILQDPSGTAARLQETARNWSWEPVAEAADRYVAAEAEAYAEEARKLAGALQAANATVAAVQRAVLALHLPAIMAIHRRILYGTENALWDVVAEYEGEPWATAQTRALGLHPVTPLEAATAALTLYRLLAAAVFDVATADQRAVIEGALEAARSHEPR